MPVAAHLKATGVYGCIQGLIDFRNYALCRNHSRN